MNRPYGENAKFAHDVVGADHDPPACERYNKHPPAKPVVFPMRAKPPVHRARIKRVNNDSRALRYDPIGACRYTIPPYSPPFPQGGLNAEKQLSRMAASLLESRLRSKSPLCGKGGWSEGPGGIVSLRRFLFIASRLSRTTRLTSGFAIQKREGQDPPLRCVCLLCCRGRGLPVPHPRCHPDRGPSARKKLRSAISFITFRIVANGLAPYGRPSYSRWSLPPM